jgi:hypothetical protein
MQRDWKPRNRAERIRARAFNVEARAGRIDNYSRLVALAREAHTIREVG